MNTRQQIFIDKLIAKPTAYLLNFLVRIAGQILRIDHNLNREFKTIAVCKFKGMGSIIQSTPMLQAIRNKYPDAQIIYVSTRANKTVLEKIDLIDTVILVNDKNLGTFISSNLKALWQLIRIRPEIYFDLEIYSDYSTLFTTFSLAKNRVGFYLRSSSFRMGIYTHMMFFNPRVSISKVYLQMAGLIGCDTGTEVLYPLQQHNHTAYDKPEKPYLVINPNASDLRLERRWHKDRFIELIQQILQRFPQYDIYLVGSPDERPYVTEIATAVNDARLLNVAGTTSIAELISIVAHATLMISNDTGPMHVAFSTQTPVVCLFGPCSPDQYAMNEHAYIIYKQVFCSPCVHDFEVPPCKGNNVCMQLITTAEVFSKVEEVLLHNLPPGDKPADHFIYRQQDHIYGQVNR